MKTTLFSGALFCATVLLFSCDNAENGGAGGKAGSAKSDQKTAACLEKFDHDYSKLLTQADILKHISIDDPAAIEVVYDAESVERHPEYGDIYYNWPSDRPDVRLSPTIAVEQPDLNSISLSNLSFNDGDATDIQGRFHVAYRNMTQEELDAGLARIEKAFEGKSAEDLENGKKMLQGRAKANNTPVEGVGDAAYWFPVSSMGKYYGTKVVVLTGNAQFAVVAKVSANDEENAEVAKKIALEVLAKCQ